MHKCLSWVAALCCAFSAGHTRAQFAPPAGQPGTSAMYKDSSAFIDWVVSCRVVRGYQDISNPGLGYASAGDSTMAYGPAGANGTVSLGDGGYAIVQFHAPVKDGPGPDFAVFENSFDGQFLELGFVEVSSDGLNFYRIPAISNTDTAIQTGGFGNTDATKIHNLAGKYKILYGTPFDIADIGTAPLLNRQSITHVKVIDVGGSIQNQYCSRDSNHHKVNDPWTTPYATSGFDLDAVGVIHNQWVTGINEKTVIGPQIYPNPFTTSIQVRLPQPVQAEVVLSSGNGVQVYSGQAVNGYLQLDTGNLPAGVYILSIITPHAVSQHKVLRY